MTQKATWNKISENVPGRIIGKVKMEFLIREPMTTKNNLIQ